MSLTIEISIGELIDKITILEIKKEQIDNPSKLQNIEKELFLLQKTWKESHYSKIDLQNQIESLKKINKALWDIEDQIRLCEQNQEFGENFVELARKVYLTNDDRAAVKRKINQKTNSLLVEEKSYQPY